MPANAGIFLDGTLTGCAARPQPQFARLQLCVWGVNVQLAAGIRARNSLDS